MSVDIRVIDLWTQERSGLLWFDLTAPQGDVVRYQAMALRRMEGDWWQARYVPDSLSKPECRGLFDALAMDGTGWMSLVMPSADEIGEMIADGEMEPDTEGKVTELEKTGPEAGTFRLDVIEKDGI